MDVVSMVDYGDLNSSGFPRRSSGANRRIGVWDRYKSDFIRTAFGAAFAAYGLLMYAGSWPTSGTSIPGEGTRCLQCEYVNAVDYISSKKGRISEVAGKYGLPPELLASTLLNENRGRERFQDWGDEINLLLGRNPSIGVCQVRVATAMENWKMASGVPISEKDAIRRLKDPDDCLLFMAMFFRGQLDRMWRDSGYFPKGTMIDPDVFVELVARYTGGPAYKSAEAWLAGVNALAQLSDSGLCGNRSEFDGRLSKGMECGPEMWKIEEFLTRNRDRINSALMKTSNPRFGGLRERPVSDFLNGRALHIRR
ncbi:MAG: hypothetical protein ACP5NX_04730 [Candidatus Bilamarchaeaceae archaeon]